LCAGVVTQLLMPWLLPWPASVALLIGALLVGSAALVWRNQRALPVAAFFFGIALCAWHGQDALDQRLPSSMADRLVTVQGRVDGLPESKSTGARFILDVDSVLESTPEVSRALMGRRLQVHWWRGGQGLRPGERWQLRLRLREIRPSTNPGSPDRAALLLRSGLDGEAHVDIHTRAVRLAAAEGVDAVRDAVSARVDQSVARVDAAGFVKALAVGDTRGISDSDWADLRRFGLTHLIAISGFHVGLVAGLGVVLVRAGWWVFPGLGRHMPRPQAAAIAALLVALAYAALAGFSLPTVRTVLMIAVVAALRWARVATSTSHTLIVAVMVIALVDPLALMAPGFWLSAGGVAVLMWSIPGSSSAWDWRVFLKAQWVASLGLLPISAFFFSQVPVLGPVANLVGIPWISLVVVPLSLAGVLLDPISPIAGAWAWQLAAGAMDLLWSGLLALPEAWSTLIWTPSPGVAGWVLAFAGVAMVLLPSGLPWRWLGLFLLLPLLIPSNTRPEHGALLVRVFDLPQGEALLVQTATRNVLIGAAPEGESGDPLVEPSLMASGVARLDLLVVARRTAGHAGASRSVVQAFSPREVWLAPSGPGQKGTTKCAKGQRWEADGVVLEVLHPAADTPLEGADADCVMRLSNASSALLLAADSGRWIAARVVRETQHLLQPHWVISGPGGAADWSAAFPQARSMVTRRPGPAAEKRLPEGTLRPDKEGAITLTIDPDGRAAWQGWRSRRSHWWDGNSP
jgi:competence protein ComEC